MTVNAVNGIGKGLAMQPVFGMQKVRDDRANTYTFEASDQVQISNLELNQLKAGDTVQIFKIWQDGKHQVVIHEQASGRSRAYRVHPEEKGIIERALNALLPMPS